MLSDTLTGATLSAPYRGKSEAARIAKSYRSSGKKLKERGDNRAAKIHNELAVVHRNLAAGRKLLSVNKAMEIGGVKPNGHPTLAIANASARWTWFIRDAGMIHDNDGRWDHPAAAFVSDYAEHPGRPTKNSWERATRNSVFRFVSNHFPIRMNDDHIAARVPIVPAAMLPKISLCNYCILWEADWETAPKDPFLLRRITREWYSIEAEWNLTNIERMVLEMAAYAGE
jgi:hypothetical protein